MKKGKTCKIQGYKTCKVLYGTVDSVNFKSLYLNLQTWVEPIKSSENWQRIVHNFSRSLKHTILDKIDKKTFNDKFIVDLDLRPSGLMEGKKSFLNLEITLFINENDEINFKSKKLKDELRKLINDILSENFQNNEFFDFYLNKKVKLDTTT
jgi:hypothetical protein